MVGPTPHPDATTRGDLTANGQRQATGSLLALAPGHPPRTEREQMTTKTAESMAEFRDRIAGYGIAELREERAGIREQLEEMLHRSGDRAMTNEEQRTYDATYSKFARAGLKIDTMQDAEAREMPGAGDAVSGDGSGRQVRGGREDRSGRDGWLAETRSLMHSDGKFGTAITPPEIASRVFDLLQRDSITLQAGVPVIPTTASELWIPRIKADPGSAWVGELELIPDSQPDGDHMLIRPRKTATLAKLSREVWTDGEPLGLRAAQASMQRSLARSIDHAFIAGSGEGEEPLGLINTPGVTTMPGVGTITNLDPFIEAIARLTAVNARASAIIVGVRELSTLLHLKRSSTAGTSDDNSPLISDPVGGTAAAAGILNVPVFVSPDLAPAGNGTSTALVIDATQLALVRRQDIVLAVDESLLFDRDGVALRATARVDFANPFPASVAKLTGITPSAA